MVTFVKNMASTPRQLRLGVTRCALGYTSMLLPPAYAVTRCAPLRSTSTLLPPTHP